MTIQRNQLHRFRARFHRNGVAGDCFLLCQFTYAKRRLLAVAELDDDDGVSAVRAVTNPSDINDRFDAFAFRDAVRQAVAELDAKNDKTRYSDESEPAQ